MLKRMVVLFSLIIVTTFAFSNHSSSQIDEPIDTSQIKINIPKIEREVAGPNNRWPMVYGKKAANGGIHTHWKSDCVGKKVQVEGIAWGQPFGKEGQKGTISPWAGAHLIYDGSSIFLRGVDYTESNARGKTVRVTGTLRFESASRTRWGKTLPYFYIQVDSFEVVERITDPTLKLDKSEKPPKATSE